MAPWIKMTWHRGLGEQTESLVTPERFGKALCTAQASVRGEMPTLLPGRVTAWSGRRCDTSGVDQNSHMSSELGALGRQAHSCLYLPTAARKEPWCWLGNTTSCFPSPTSFQTTITRRVRGKHYGFSDTGAPLKPGDIRADVKHASVGVCVGEICPSLQLSCETPWGEPADNKS